MLVGGVIGVTIMETLSQILADTYPEIWPVVLGLLLLLIIVFRPTGLIGLLIRPSRAYRCRSGGSLWPAMSATCLC